MTGCKIGRNSVPFEFSSSSHFPTKVKDECWMILKLKMLNDYLDKNMFYYLHIIIVTSGYCQLIFNEEEVTFEACDWWYC